MTIESLLSELIELQKETNRLLALKVISASLNEAVTSAPSTTATVTIQQPEVAKDVEAPKPARGRGRPPKETAPVVEKRVEQVNPTPEKTVDPFETPVATSPAKYDDKDVREALTAFAERVEKAKLAAGLAPDAAKTAGLTRVRTWMVEALRANKFSEIKPEQYAEAVEKSKIAAI